LRPSPNSAQRFRDLPRKILQSAVVSFVSDAIRVVSIFFPIGVDFEAAWPRRVEAVIDVKLGLKVFFISAEDLVTSKLAAGRPQDLADVDAIRKAQRTKN
jgi:hypothetical protein